MSALLSSITGGGNKAPTSLDFVVTTASSNTQISEVTNEFGAKVSSSITSSTLTQVLNKSGSGFFTFLSIINIANVTVSNPKILIIIDGVTVLNVSSGTTITGTQNISILGRHFRSTNSVSTESRIDYKKSLVVDIAGDGTNGVALAFKQVET